MAGNGLFYGGGLARAYKEAWDAELKSIESEMTPEELAEFRKPPVWLKNTPGTWLSEERTFIVEPFHTEAVYQGQPIPDLKVCECGVGIVGGLHSDWCPAKD